MLSAPRDSSRIAVLKIPQESRAHVLRPQASSFKFKRTEPGSRSRFEPKRDGWNVVTETRMSQAPSQRVWASRAPGTAESRPGPGPVRTCSPDCVIPLASFTPHSSPVLAPRLYSLKSLELALDTKQCRSNMTSPRPSDGRTKTNPSVLSFNDEQPASMSLITSSPGIVEPEGHLDLRRGHWREER